MDLLLFLQRGYNNVLGSVALRNKLIDVENAIKVVFHPPLKTPTNLKNLFFTQLANDDGTVTYDEIRNQLKK